MIKNLLTLATILGTATLGIVAFPQEATSQVKPQPWVSVGGEDGEVSYSVGARWLNFGAELGGRGDGAVGVDALTFIALPIVSPYIGLGLYADAEDDIAFSGGVQVRPPGDVFIGVGYHSIRGVNGQLGIKF